MIDNGCVFDGGYWRFEDSPARGPYFGKVYEQVRSLDAFAPWLTAVANFPEELLRNSFQRMPISWRRGDAEAAFEMLLDQLMRRRRVDGFDLCVPRLFCKSISKMVGTRVEGR
jgi:hypothetical protein